VKRRQIDKEVVRDERPGSEATSYLKENVQADLPEQPAFQNNPFGLSSAFQKAREAIVEKEKDPLSAWKAETEDPLFKGE
jgi:hypothetical protein